MVLGRIIIGLALLVSPVTIFAEAPSNCPEVMYCANQTYQPLDCLVQRHSLMARGCRSYLLSEQEPGASVLWQTPFMIAMLLLVCGFVVLKPRRNWYYGFLLGVLYGVIVYVLHTMSLEWHPYVARLLRHAALPVRGLMAYSPWQLGAMSFGNMFIVCNAILFSVTIGLYTRNNKNRVWGAVAFVGICTGLSVVDLMFY